MSVAVKNVKSQQSQRDKSLFNPTLNKQYNKSLLGMNDLSHVALNDQILI